MQYGNFKVRQDKNKDKIQENYLMYLEEILILRCTIN